MWFVTPDMAANMEAAAAAVGDYPRRYECVDCNVSWTWCHARDGDDGEACWVCGRVPA